MAKRLEDHAGVRREYMKVLKRILKDARKGVSEPGERT